MARNNRSIEMQHEIIILIRINNEIEETRVWMNSSILAPVKQQTIMPHILYRSYVSKSYFPKICFRIIGYRMARHKSNLYKRSILLYVLKKKLTFASFRSVVLNLFMLNLHFKWANHKHPFYTSKENLLHLTKSVF